MKIRRWEPADEARIARLNDRLRRGGVDWPVWNEGPPPSPDDPIAERMYVASEDDEVRGAVWLREHEFRLRGTTITAGWAKYPVAESLVDPAFGGVPGALILKIQREQPRLMALGMGGVDGNFAKLLRSMRWEGVGVPFLVRFNHPARVLRALRALRSSRLRRVGADVLAATGIGWLGWRAYETARRTLARATPLDVEVVESFGGWADALWERDAGAYTFIARRDAAMLNRVYPPAMPVTRLRLRRDGADIGWACVVDRDLRDKPDTAFGPLRVGLVADALGAPRDATSIVAAADAYLAARGVDLTFTNQSHDAWCAAFRRAGYLEAPSQFAFFRSVAAGRDLGPLTDLGELYLNRGDCDGPIFA